MTTPNNARIAPVSPQQRISAAARESALRLIQLGEADEWDRGPSTITILSVVPTKTSAIQYKGASWDQYRVTYSVRKWTGVKYDSSMEVYVHGDDVEDKNTVDFLNQEIPPALLIRPEPVVQPPANGPLFPGLEV